MAFQQKDNSGALFTNEKKENQKQPDYNGSIMVRGVEYWLAGWAKDSKGGKRFLSLAVTPKEKKEDQPAPEQGGDQSVDLDGRPLPF